MDRGLALQFLTPQAVKKPADADGKREKLPLICRWGQQNGEAATNLPQQPAGQRGCCRIAGAVAGGTAAPF
ncbi:hypothetical protein UY3_13359 [Chelonia mydas]|uniref:Uncharacterized protein n=1 Tax=Chelonia mydas TaxID=8469 RepID=M7AXR1_CHEMY|nr:hypothetical protein UY3_13359 [Chelonia mydas]